MNRSETEAQIRARPDDHYVYVLTDPAGAPFYVGQGRGRRLFAHEDEARDPDKRSDKNERIRQIWDAGGDVGYSIDSWHDSAPWQREAELIRDLGREHPLTNAQRYAPAGEIEGAVTRKYRDAYADGTDVRAVPPDFRYTHERLAVGPRRPRSGSSVYGRIYAVLERNPGITGAELIEGLHRVDWSDVPSAYAEGRESVCGKWLSKYVEGGFYKKNQHIALYQE